MAAEEGSVQDGVLLNSITVRAVLDGEGDRSIEVAYSSDLQISEALGLLEYAKYTLLQIHDRNRGD